MKEWHKYKDEPQRRKLHFMPQRYNSLREVPAYSRYIRERFLRCLDLYLCPRAKRMKVCRFLGRCQVVDLTFNLFCSWPSTPSILSRNCRRRKIFNRFQLLRVSFTLVTQTWFERYRLNRMANISFPDQTIIRSKVRHHWHPIFRPFFQEIFFLQNFSLGNFNGSLYQNDWYRRYCQKCCMVSQR